MKIGKNVLENLVLVLMEHMISADIDEKTREITFTVPINEGNVTHRELDALLNVMVEIHEIMLNVSRVNLIYTDEEVKLDMSDSEFREEIRSHIDNKFWWLLEELLSEYEPVSCSEKVNEILKIWETKTGERPDRDTILEIMAVIDGGEE